MKPKKIVVVDDSKLMIKMYEVMLRQYPLVYASDGHSVRDRLEEHHDIELMLLSLNLPTLNSLELLEKLERRDNLRILIIAREGHEDDIARALELGAHGAITLPFQAEELNHVITKLT